MESHQPSKTTPLQTKSRSELADEAVRLFQRGNDTCDIARVLNVSEAEAYTLLNFKRWIK